MASLRALPPLLLVSSLWGCQFISGIDELESGSGGGGTNSSTGSTGATTGGGCPMVQGGPCSSTAPMTCPEQCEGDVCKITCPDSPMCEGTMSNASDMACGEPNTTNYPCVFDCGPLGPANCSDKRIICPASSPRCEVICHGAGACASTEIVCGEGECKVTCEMGACSGDTIVRCSHGPCQVNCSIPDLVKPKIENVDLSCSPSLTGCQ
jgi:hypothetical protein